MGAAWLPPRRQVWQFGQATDGLAERPRVPSAVDSTTPLRIQGNQERSMRKTGLDQPVHLRWVRYLACFHGREERNDLVRIEEFADPVRELLKFRGEIRPLMADLHETQQFFAYQISEGIVDTKTFPNAVSGGALIDPDLVEF